MALEISKTGFDSMDNHEIRRAIKNKYKMRTGYLVEYEVDKYFSLSSNGSGIGKYDLANPGHQFKGWKINRWPDLYIAPEIQFSYREIGIKKELGAPTIVRGRKTAGCLGETPLRYGSLKEGDANEHLIVLFLNGQLVLFSPEYEQVVFADYYDGSEWLGFDKSTGLRDEGYPFTVEVDAQYFSEIYWGVDVGMPGYRIYSKIYVDDFDSDNNLDFVVWRKIYKSNTPKGTAGFKLIRQEYKHYERNLTKQAGLKAGVTGEYLPQITTDVVIQSWLRDKELTWQKGFPSKSECAGQEGQLIPEMHDPLLNDPDVLK